MTTTPAVHLIRAWSGQPADEQPICGRDRFDPDVWGYRTVEAKTVTCAICRTVLARIGKTYRGHRDAAGIGLVEVVDVDAEVGRPLEHRVRHSPTGLEWGYGGSGPADTARSILADYLGYLPHPAVYQRFKSIIVAPMPRDRWTLQGIAIEGALVLVRRDVGASCLRCLDTSVIENDTTGLLDYCDCAAGQAARDADKDSEG